MSIETTEEKPIPKTKKAAKELGFRTSEQWTIKWRIPRIGEVGLRIRDDDFFSESQTEELITKTKAKSIGLRIPNGLEPETWVNCRIRGVWHAVDVYRISSLEPCKIKNSKPPIAIDIGIREAVRSGRLVFQGVEGGFGIYTGEGYYFHSPQVPIETEVTECDSESAYIEAKSKTKAEARLKDAEFTLSNLSDDQCGFSPIKKQPRFGFVPKYDDTFGFDSIDDDEDNDDMLLD
ncbi:MAG: hypothetical protein Q8M16_15070 [Pirellulaceae bacterium]|nr:hypothetical protein [Pirellulaceae bacterium]